MKFLLKFGLTEDDIKYIKSKYDKKIISCILYKEENVIELINYFKKLKFNIKSLLINRLDLFLIDYNIIKNKIDSYDKKQIIEILQNDISLLDNL